MWLMFIDSMFNTIVPHRLVSKVRGLGLNPSLCRPQVVRIRKCSSSTRRQGSTHNTSDGWRNLRCPQLQRPFYTTAVKSVHTGSTTPWYGSCTSVDWRALHKVMHYAQRTTGTTLPTLQDFYTCRYTTRARKIIIKDIHHLAINLQWLPSGSPLRSYIAKTGRVMKSWWRAPRP